MKEFTLSLTADEINGILKVLGDLPTHTGAWVLLTKVKQQVDEQVKREPETK